MIHLFNKNAPEPIESDYNDISEDEQHKSKKASDPMESDSNDRISEDEQSKSRKAPEPMESDSNDRISKNEQSKSPLFRKSTRQNIPKVFCLFVCARV